MQILIQYQKEEVKHNQNIVDTLLGEWFTHYIFITLITSKDINNSVIESLAIIFHALLWRIELIENFGIGLSKHFASFFVLPYWISNH